MRDVYEDSGTESYRTFWRTGQGVYVNGEANLYKGSRRVTKKFAFVRKGTTYELRGVIGI